jgi:oligopeptide/dipeptide ABC transporter ATP-binding protein
MLIVSHDLTTVRRSTDRLLVMYAGRIAESASTTEATRSALHPYTQGLLAASPTLRHRAWSAIPGSAPALSDLQAGCGFSDRCPHSSDACRSSPPSPIRFGSHTVECHLYSAVSDQPAVVPTPVRTAFPTVAERPRTGNVTDAGELGAVVTVRSVAKTFRSRRWFTTTETEALVDVDLDVAPGEIVGLVGVSGSGKSTLARTLFGLVQPDCGDIVVAGERLVGASKSDVRRLRRRLAFVHQDPYASLHPAMSITDLVAEPLAIAGVPRPSQRRRAAEALEVVGLGGDAEFLGRRAGQLSGGQRQRVAIARALVAEPVLMVLDEPMSMLDSSVRAGIAAALLDVRDLVGMAAVVITHDLAEAAAICDRIVVLDAGRVVENRPTRELIHAPEHEATRTLLRLVESEPEAEGDPRGSEIEDEHV